MVTITATDALGTGLVIYEDADGITQPLFPAPLDTTLTLDTLDGEDTLFRFAISGHTTIVAASALGLADATTVTLDQVTYETASAETAIHVSDLDLTLSLANYPYPAPDISAGVLATVSEGMFLVDGDDRLTGNSFADFISGLGGVPAVPRAGARPLDFAPI